MSKQFSLKLCHIYICILILYLVSILQKNCCWDSIEKLLLDISVVGYIIYLWPHSAAYSPAKPNAYSQKHVYLVQETVEFIWPNRGWFNQISVVLLAVGCLSSDDWGNLTLLSVLLNPLQASLGMSSWSSERTRMSKANCASTF